MEISLKNFGFFDTHVNERSTATRTFWITHTTCFINYELLNEKCWLVWHLGASRSTPKNYLEFHRGLVLKMALNSNNNERWGKKHVAGRTVLKIL